MPLSIVCELTPETMRAFRAGLLPGLAERAHTREATADGYRLTFEPSTDTLRAITRLLTRSASAAGGYGSTCPSHPRTDP